MKRLREINFIPDYIAYTDGSCNNMSPFGEGGSAFILLNGTKDKVLQTWSKSLLNTTNNRAELLAILCALSAVPYGSTVLVRTDSQYCITVLDSPEQYLPKANRDIISKCFEVMNKLSVVCFEWVRGHAGSEYNEQADALADSRREEVRVKFRIPVYTYKEYKRPFTEEEKLRLRRFNEWMSDSPDYEQYSDMAELK